MPQKFTVSQYTSNVCFQTAMERDQRVFLSPLGRGNDIFLGSSQTAYFIYVGRTTAPMTPQYIESWLSVVGVGVSSVEVGLFSSPAPPKKAAQTLTKITSTATYDSLISGTGTKRNTGAALATLVPAGTYLWAGLKVITLGTNPTYWGLSAAMQEGYVLTTGTAGTFSDNTSWAGLIPAETGAATPPTIGPELRVTLD